jgi:hypothetical protein
MSGFFNPSLEQLFVAPPGKPAPPLVEANLTPLHGSQHDGFERIVLGRCPFPKTRQKYWWNIQDVGDIRFGSPRFADPEAVLFQPLLFRNLSRLNLTFAVGQA